MTALDIAGLLKDYGWPGACAILCVVVAYLHRGWNACQEARIADSRVAVAALTTQGSSNVEIAAMMGALREGQTEVMKVVAILQRDTENGDGRTKERIEALTGAVAELGRRLEQACRGGPR